LVSTDSHIPLLSHLYPGNQNDAAMFSSITENLVARCKQVAGECEDITLVFDGGNNSADNIQAFEQSPYHFVTSLTVTHHTDLLSIPLNKFQSFDDPRLAGTKAFRTHKQLWGKTRTVVITRSDRLLNGQIAGINRALSKKRAALRELKGKLQRSQRPAARGKGYSHESLQRRLDSICSGQYTSQILKTQISEAGAKIAFQFWTDWSAYDQLKRRRLGKRILCTDNKKWSTQEIILAARAQHHVEQAFKQMKNPHWVSFSPAFHWTDQKLRVHAFYCVLALLLSSVLQRKAVAGGMKLSIDNLMEQLSTVSEIVNLYGPQEKGSRGRYRAGYILSERSALQHKLCTILEVYKYAHR